MTSDAPSDVLVFDSSALPARLANDLDASPEAKGKACLQRILKLIESPTIETRLEPTAHGSGFSAYVSASGIEVVIHLTWFPEGPPRGSTRDVWTLQFQRARNGLLDLLRNNDVLKRDKAAVLVANAVTDAFRSRSSEFVDPRWCDWRDLER